MPRFPGTFLMLGCTAGFSAALRPAAPGPGAAVPPAGLPLPAMALALFLFPAATKADRYNQKTILVGDKAAALGGAFAGLADDATATFYNPAGLVQLKQARLNVSAQIVQFQKQQIDISPTRTLPYSSFNFSPSISTLSQRLGPVAAGFSVVTSHNDLFRGGASIETPYTDSATGLPHHVDISLGYYDVSKTNLIGPSLAFALGERLSFGITVYAVYSTQLEETSFKEWRANHTGEDDTDKARYYENTVDRSTNHTGLGATAKLGILLRLDSTLSMGVCASPGGRMRVTREEKHTVEILRNDSLVYAGVPSPANTLAAAYHLATGAEHVEDLAPSLSLGGAWRPLRGLTLAAQVDYRPGRTFTYASFSPEPNLAARSGFEVFEAGEERFALATKAVVDFSAGVDWRVDSVYSLTWGLFTDFSQGPYDERPSSWNKRIDYFGGALALGLEKRFTESRFGINFAWGDAGISHMRWKRDSYGRPRPVEKNGSVDLSRRHFDALIMGIFTSTTLKI